MSLAQVVAYFRHDWRHDSIEEVVPLDIEIGGLRSDAQLLYFILRLEIRFLGFREFTLQLPHFYFYLVTNIVERSLWVVDGEATRVGDAVELGDGELVVHTIAIAHDVPDEEGEYDLGELLKVGLKVKDAAVDEGDSDAYIVQCWRIALKVLYGVDISMEDVWAFQHLLRLRRGSLKQEVEVSIDAGNHIAAQTVVATAIVIFCDEVHEYRLLASGKVSLGREHHLEVALVVFEA